jgi:hypothetical protein
MDNFEFQIPDRKVKVALSKFNQMELDKFAVDFYAKGQTWNILCSHIEDLRAGVEKQEEWAKVKNEAGEEITSKMFVKKSIKDFSNYAQRFESLVREQTQFALRMFQELSNVLRNKVVSTSSDKDNGLDLRKEEDWNKVFDKEKAETLRFLLVMGTEFIASHKPDEAVAKN